MKSVSFRTYQIWCQQSHNLSHNEVTSLYQSTFPLWPVELVGKTLSLDLRDPGLPIAITHGSLKGHDMFSFRTGCRRQFFLKPNILQTAFVLDVDLSSK